VETNEATVFFTTNHTVDFVGGEQVAVLAVAETTFRAPESPEGLIDHATHLLDASTPPLR
jgi:hypothetical protein